MHILGVHKMVIPRFARVGSDLIHWMLDDDDDDDDDYYIITSVFADNQFRFIGMMMMVIT